MPQSYIETMMSAWRPDSGLVCSPPLGSRPDGFWAHVECAFLNGSQGRWQYAAEAIGMGFAQGKSMLWNKPFLEERGGIRALAAEIAEDAASTKLVRNAGRKVHLVSAPFEQPLGQRQAGEIWSRQTRWARLRRVTFRNISPRKSSPARFPAPLRARCRRCRGCEPCRHRDCRTRHHVWPGTGARSSQPVAGITLYPSGNGRAGCHHAIRLGTQLDRQRGCMARQCHDDPHGRKHIGRTFSGLNGSFYLKGLHRQANVSL